MVLPVAGDGIAEGRLWMSAINFTAMSSILAPTFWLVAAYAEVQRIQNLTARAG